MQTALCLFGQNFQFILQFRHESIQIAFCLGSIAKWADCVAFARSEVPQVMLAKDSFGSLGWSKAGLILLPYFCHCSVLEPLLETGSFLLVVFKF